MSLFFSEPRVALTIYRWLARLYPRSLRRDLGDEMEGLFLDLHVDARELGMFHAAWFVLRAWCEVAPRAFQAHGDPDSPTGAYLVRSFFLDLRFAWLAATRQRRHTAVVVATIAIGVGATTAVFSVTDAAIIRRLPFPEAHRLVNVGQKHPAGVILYGFDAATYAVWGEQTELFDVMGGYETTKPVTEIAGEPREIDGVRISPSLLPLLGVQPVMGRLLTEEDAAEGAAPVTLISERVWLREFARDPDLQGKWLALDGVDHEVVGVLPERFAFPARRTDSWLPADPTRGDGSFRSLARIAPGVGLDRAREMAGAVAAGMAEEARGSGWELALMPLDDDRTSPRTRTALLVGLSAAGLLLLVAVVNVAQVSLARAIQREGELTMRAALGAGRGRIIRQVLFESLIMSLVGGVLGIGLAHGLVDVIAAAAPDNMVEIDAIRIGIDWRAMSIAIALAVGAGVAAGLLPAWSASRRSAAVAMKQRQRGLSSSRSRRRVQSGLIIAEAALCMVLMAGAGLLLNSFERLVAVDPGFDSDRLISMVLRLDDDLYPTPESRLAMLETLQERVGRLAGVERATIGGDAAPRPGGTMLLGSLETDEGERIDGNTIVPYGRISEGYFDATGIEVIDGRGLDQQDYDTRNTVIGEPFARRLFGETSAVGRRFREEDGDWWTVVGVAASTAVFNLQSSEDSFQAYFALKSDRTPRAYAALIVRATGDPALLQPQLQQALWDLDPRQPVRRFELGTDTMAGWVVEPRFNTLVFGTFAVVALLLVLVGVAGVVGHTVISRTREIGIRVALGASDASVLRLATLGGLRPVLAGLALGTIGAWQSTHLIASLLYGVEPNDPSTLLGVALVFLAATLLASYLPARNALRIDPVRALRSE